MSWWRVAPVTLCLALAPTTGYAQGVPCAIVEEAGTASLCDWPVRLRLGPRYVIRRDPTTPEDFDLFEVRPRADTTRAILALYVGYHPRPSPRSARPIRIGSLAAREVRAAGAGERSSRDVWVQLPQRYGGVVVHAWYRALGGAEAAEADRLLSSLHLR